jgi:hypothetical protein
MTNMRTRVSTERLGLLFGVSLIVNVGLAATVPAQDCTAFVNLFQQGLSDRQIAGATGLTINDVAACRRQLQHPIVVGPQGPPPIGAAGPPPLGAAGPPPLGAAGPPPAGAAGAPRVGIEGKRVP